MALVYALYVIGVLLFELDGTIRPLSLLVHCCSLLFYNNLITEEKWEDDWE